MKPTPVNPPVPTGLFSPRSERGSFPPRLAPGRCSWCWHAPEASLRPFVLLTLRPAAIWLNFPLQKKNKKY